MERGFEAADIQQSQKMGLHNIRSVSMCLSNKFESGVTRMKYFELKWLTCEKNLAENEREDP